MSNIEHLFENAICAHLRGETYEDFCKYPGNQMMIADEETDPEVIWMLAQYTVSTYEIPRWIPVTERLPEEWTEVLVFGKCHLESDGFVQTAVYIGIPGKWRVTWNHDLLECNSVTHWMPLPALPEVE